MKSLYKEHPIKQANYLPTSVFSNVKPSTFHILTVLSEDAVARYLYTTIFVNIKSDNLFNQYEILNICGRILTD